MRGMLRIRALVLLIGCLLDPSRATHHHQTITVRERKTGGLFVPKVTPKIVGGTDAAPGEFPWFVKGFGCGATLVAPNVVVSAAHCVGSFDSRVTVGPSHFYDDGEVVRTNLQQQILHPSFNANTLSFDVMLIQLAEEVSAEPVTINWDPAYPATGSRQVLTTMGFGATNGKDTDLLQKVDLRYYDPEPCREHYGSFTVDDNIMLCAGYVYLRMRGLPRD